ncbi:MAG: hypothetical protein IH895_00780 [Planctomycetes bacterium]|nr:hypothetical protein [Planctomycetota bacterium]
MIRLSNVPNVIAKGTRATTLIMPRKAFHIQDTDPSIPAGSRLRRYRLRRSADAIQASARAVQHIHEIVGAAGIREAHSFQRHFRDVQVITQHGFTNMAKLESVG